MLIDTYTLCALSDATQLRFFLLDKDHQVQAELRLRAGTPPFWHLSQQDPEQPPLPAEDLVNSNSALYQQASLLLGTTPVETLFSDTLSFIETRLSEGLEGVYVDMEDTTFSLHARSNTRTTRTGTPKPKTRSLKTRVWI
jgi:hypothetical protein